MNGPQLEAEEFEIESDGPISDTLIGLLYGGTVRRGPAPAQPASIDESTDVRPAPEGKPRYKSRYKPRPKRSPKQSTAKRTPNPGTIAQTTQALAPAAESSLERHQRKCEICAHPEREMIEQDFLSWHNPKSTAYDYKFPVRSLYRHAHATGLHSYRKGNLRAVLDRILERVDNARLTGDTIIRAVRAYTCLTPENTWVEPASRVIFSTAPSPSSESVANGSASQKLLETSTQTDPSAIALAAADQFLIDTPAIRT